MLAAKDRWHNYAATSGAPAYTLVVGEAHMDRQAEVKLAADPKARDRGSLAFEFELLLRADDPLRYATALSSVVADLPTADESGMTFDVVFDLTFGAGGSGGAAFATNAGNAPAWPVITLSGPVSNPSIRNATSNRTVALNLTLASDESLVIDMAARTVLLNGTANRRNALLPSSAWWAIEPGSNEIQYRAAAFTASTATVTYRSAWK
jgi:hypothetical protein